MNSLDASPEEVRAQAARILQSRHFDGSELLGQFLRYIVEETLDGRAAEIDEYVIGVAVYRNPNNFDPRVDSTVRSEASRLRGKLAEFYTDEGRSDALVISLPKGGYVPAIERHAPAARRPPAKSYRFPAAIAFVAGALLTCAGVAWRLTSTRSDRSLPPMRQAPLTSLPGTELTPSFSPDGETVAFVWTYDVNGESSFEDPNARVFIASVQGSSQRRLTKTDLGAESAPAWAPSGKEVALLGNVRGDTAIYVVSVMDGQARKILAVPQAGPETLSWSPDSRLLTYAQRDAGRPFTIRTVSIQDGRKRELTTPPDSVLGDANPAFSPDGRWIVFVRRSTPLVSDLYLMPASGGEPRRLTGLSTDIRGNAWMPDSHEIVFSAETAGVYSLKRIRINDDGAHSTPSPVAEVGGDGIYPALGHSRDGAVVLAFARFNRSTNIWRADNLAPNRELEFSRVAPSTRTDYDPSFSPDGSSIAFASNRSGSFEIWVCSKDGANPRALTSFGGPDLGSPRWSPDGRHIAFDAQPGSNPDVYVVDSNGGPAQRITSQPSDDARPSWSGDGHWIYFRSNRAGKQQIWKIPFTGRTEPAEHAEPVTRATAHEAFESPDCKWIYFLHQSGLFTAKTGWGTGSELWRVPIAGGAEQKVLDGAPAGAWALTESGIFFLQPNGSQSATLIRVAQSNPSVMAVIAKIDRRIDEDTTALAVTRDERSAVLAFQSRLDSDLFLVQNFR